MVETVVKIGGDASGAKKAFSELDASTARSKKAVADLKKVIAATFAANTAAIAATTKKYAEFEKSFTSVTSLLIEGGKLNEEFAKTLKQGALTLSAQYGQAVDATNNALFSLVSAGVDAGESIEFLEQAMRLAEAGSTDVATATNALVAAYSAFGEEAGTAEEIAQSFFAAQKFGITTVGELASEFNKVGAQAKNLGLSYDETLASMAALTTSGMVPQAQAATQISALMTGLVRSQSRLAEESSELQEALSLTSVKTNGLEGSLLKAKDAMIEQGLSADEITIKFQKILGSSEAVAAAQGLLGAASESLIKIQENLSDELERTDTFNKAVADSTTTVDAQTRQMRESFNTLLILLGEKFLPVITELIKNLTALIRKLTDPAYVEITAKIMKIVGAVTAFSAALYASIKATRLAIAVYTLFSKTVVAVTTAFKFLNVVLRANPIGAIVTAVTIVIAAFQDWDKITKKINVTIDNFIQKGGFLGASLKKLRDIIVDVVGWMGKFLGSIFSVGEATGESLSGFEEAESALGSLSETVENTGESIDELNKKEIKIHVDNEDVADSLHDILDASEELIEGEIENYNRLVDSFGDTQDEMTNSLAHAAAERIEKMKEEHEQQIANSGLSEEEAQVRLDRLEFFEVSESEHLEKLKDIREVAASSQVEIEKKLKTDVGKIQETARKEEIAASKTQAAELEKIEKEHNATSLKNEKDVWGSRLEMIREGSAAMKSLSISGGATIARINQAMQLKSATIDLSRAVMSALAIPPSPNLKAAAKAVAAGTPHISTIAAQKFNTGGIVDSGPAGIDTVPALLTRGEMVLPKALTEKAVNVFNGLNETLDGKAVNFNITVEGNMVDNKEFARELIPEIQEVIQEENYKL